MLPIERVFMENNFNTQPCSKCDKHTHHKITFNFKLQDKKANIKSALSSLVTALQTNRKGEQKSIKRHICGTLTWAKLVKTQRRILN